MIGWAALAAVLIAQFDDRPDGVVKAEPSQFGI